MRTAFTPNRAQILERYEICGILIKSPISETVKIVTIEDHSKIVCPLALAVIFISIVT